MDNLPDYNPLEVDEGGWIPVRTNNLSLAKPCWFCKHAPVITFILADLYAGYHGYVHESMWLIIQLLFASTYIKDTERFLEVKTDGKIQWNISGIMLVLMLGITLRATLFILLFS